MGSSQPATDCAGLSKIGQIAINIKDTARATEFYRDKLGMKLLFCAGPMSFFDCAGVRIMLSPPAAHPLFYCASGDDLIENCLLALALA